MLNGPACTDNATTVDSELADDYITVPVNIPLHTQMFPVTIFAISRYVLSRKKPSPNNSSFALR